MDELMNKKEARVLLLFLLKQLNNICENYDIPYYASGGTCLGAIRHNGFIPWDDDIDVMIPRKYYERFVDVCSKELISPVLLRTRENDPWFCQEYTKLCFMDDVKGFSDISIDVFFLDETDKEKPIFRSIQNRVLTDLYYVKKFKVSKDGHGQSYRPSSLLKYLYLTALSVMSYKTIDKLHKSIMLAQKKTTDYWVNWGSCYSYKKATYSKQEFGKPTKHEFENTYVYVAEHPEEVLVHLYGENYMTPPPENKRTDHGVRMLHCSKLDYEKVKEEVGNF